MLASNCENSISVNTAAPFKFSHSVSVDLNWVFATLIFISANAFGLYRTFFGINFFDEPFYAALPFRFLYGQKLFVQDFTLAQTFAIPIYPFIKIHSLLFQGTEYLILFLRFCHWSLNLGLEMFLFYLLRREIPSAIALIITVSAGLFLPGNIPTLSYNTMGTLFLTLGLFTSFYAFYSNRSSLYFISGIGMGLCALTYVTFISIALLVGIQVAISNRKNSNFLFYALGMLLVLLGPTLIMITRLDTLHVSFAISKEYGYSSNKIISMIVVLHKFFPKKVLGPAFLFSLGFYISWKAKHLLRFIFILSIPIFAFVLSELSTQRWPAYPFYLSILGIIPFFTIHRTTSVNALMTRIFIPSFIAGLVAALTSALGSLNAQVGLIPAVLVSLIFIYFAMSQAPKSVSRLSPIFLALPVIFAMVSPITIWDESPMGQLTEKVNRGPYRGLYTSPAKKSYLDTVSTALLSSLTTKGPLLIYPNFTAGYLIAGISPASGLLWYQNPKGGVDSYLARAYRNEMSPKSRILRMKVWYSTPRLKTENIFDPDSPINKIIASHHYPISDNEWFTLYAPR